VYSRGGGALQQQLLGQLLGLLQGSAGPAGGPGASAAGAAGVKIAPDTKLFEEGQLGNTPGEPEYQCWCWVHPAQLLEKQPQCGWVDG
jgi:hypothetical protein